MDTKITVKLKEKLRKIMQPRFQRTPEPKNAADPPLATPKFATDDKLPSLSPLRTNRTSAKPFPTANINLSSQLNISDRSISKKSPSPYRLSNNRSIVNKSPITIRPYEYMNVSRNIRVLARLEGGSNSNHTRSSVILNLLPREPTPKVI